MYCSKCGYRIIAGQKVCPECNSDIREIEFNGGFWDMVNTAESAEEPPISESEKSEKSEKTEKTDKTASNGAKTIRTSHIFSIIFLITTVAFLAASIGFGVWAFIMNSKYHDEVDVKTQLETELEDAKTQHEAELKEAREEYEALEQEKTDLQNTVDALQAENENLEKQISDERYIFEETYEENRTPGSIGGATESGDSQINTNDEEYVE